MLIYIYIYIYCNIFNEILINLSNISINLFNLE
jgi:hypothetical protein